MTQHFTSLLPPAGSPELECARGVHSSDRRSGNTVAFLSSLVLHVALLLLLACVAYQAGKKSDGLMLMAEAGDSPDTALEINQNFEVQPEIEVVESLPQVDSPEVTLDYELEQQLPQPEVGTSGLVASLTSLSMEDVTASLASPQKGRGASFFGAYAEGNRFIYVLDSSRSMKGDRWVYACNRLLDSLNELKDGQEFFILCFDMQTSYLFNDRPQGARFYKADDDVVRQVRRWLRGRTLGQATMPAEALRIALGFNPDAVFLLSDGELQDNTLGVLRQFNSGTSQYRQIPIHTIHLFSEFGRASLETIAMENQGTFTHIDRL